MNARVPTLALAHHLDAPDFSGSFGWVESRFEAETATLWSIMNPRGRPCFSERLLRDLRNHESLIERSGAVAACRGDVHPIHYVVYASAVKGVFNLGGDLDLFRALIERRDREALLAYATLCIDNLYPRVMHYGLPLTTIALVQGDAMGGGMEAALASHVVIAERTARMGMPEVFFNLFPGMGGYSFLVRKVGAAMADTIIHSRRIYSAPELKEMGLVDVVADDGLGEMAVADYIRTHAERRNAYVAMQRAKACIHPITYPELMEITTIWVDAAMGLTPRDLKTMGRLVQRQSGLAARCSA